MRRAALTTCALLVASLPAVASAESEEEAPRVRLDGMLGFSRFEQQVKSEVGGARGERLVEDTELALGVEGAYRFWGPLSVGVFARFEVGKREAGRFEGFDAEGRAVVAGEVGGSYSELWLGPLLRVEHWHLFFEVGYAPLGVRHDAARDDLPATDGDTDSALRTHPSIAWMLALGGGVPVSGSVELTARLEYRVRYYDSRGGDALGGDVVHGTQSFTPLLGVAWRFGPR